MRHRSGRQADWRQQLGEKKRRGGRGRGKGCASFATCKPHSASAREPRSREQEPMADAARHPRHLGGKWTRLPRIGGQEGSQGATGEAAAGVLVRRRCRWRWGGGAVAQVLLCCTLPGKLGTWVPPKPPSGGPEARGRPTGDRQRPPPPPPSIVGTMEMGHRIGWKPGTQSAPGSERAGGGQR